MTVPSGKPVRLHRRNLCTRPLRSGSFGWLALLLAPQACHAACNVYDNGEWAVCGVADTGPNPKLITVSACGVPKGTWSELSVYHEVPGIGCPQVFAVRGSGYLRGVLPGGAWGTAFLTTGLYVEPEVYVQATEITDLNVCVYPGDPHTLVMTGNADTKDDGGNVYLHAQSFALKLSAPTPYSVRARVSYDLVAARSFSIDTSRQSEHQGFRVAQFRSNFIDGTRDSEAALYRNTNCEWPRTPFFNEDRFVFTQPLPMADEYLYCIASGTKPTCALQINSPPYGQCIPQGWIAHSDDPNDDNVALWMNWEGASASYSAGEKVGTFDFSLHTISPWQSTKTNGIKWVGSMVLPTNLVRSYDNEDSSYTYDQALALVLFAEAKEADLAKRVADALVTLENADGSWFDAYCGTNRDVLDRARHTGNVAWASYALCRYVALAGGTGAAYLNAARAAGDWLAARQSGNGGLTGGFDANDSGLLWKSVEHNLDAWYALNSLAALTGQSKYRTAADQVKQWLLTEGWNAAEGRFNRGEKDPVPALDCQTWGAVWLLQQNDAAKADSAIEFAEKTLRRAQCNLTGFDLYAPPDTIWAEGTGQVSNTYWYLGKANGAAYQQEMAKAQWPDGSWSHSLDDVQQGEHWHRKWRSVAGTVWNLFALMTAEGQQVPFLDLRGVSGLPDLVPPTVTGCGATTKTIKVVFSESVNTIDATTKANYTVTVGRTIVNLGDPKAPATTVTYDPGTKTTAITASKTKLPKGAVVKVKVTGVRDLGGNPIVDDGTTNVGTATVRRKEPSVVLKALQVLPAGKAMALRWALSSEARVQVRIKSANGSVVRTLGRSEAKAGLNMLIWDGKLSSGRMAGPGLYLLEVLAQTEDGRASRAVRAISRR